MTCKECISYQACSAKGGLFNEKDETKEMLCGYFKDKSKIIELPCNVGDKVYSICEAFGSVLTYKIECVHFWSNSVIGFEAFSSGNDELLDTIDFELDDIGKTVFLIKE